MLSIAMLQISYATLKRHRIETIITQEMLNQINAYLLHLDKWSKRIALTSNTPLSEDQFVTRYLIQAVELAKLISATPPLKILDIGTGNGLPAILVSIISSHNITCCEKSLKKCTFLRDVANHFSVPIDIKQCDVRTLSEKYDIITAQAVSSLTNLLSLMTNVSRETSIGYFIKGQHAQSEIEDAKLTWHFNYNVYNVSNESKIIEITNLCPKK